MTHETGRLIPSEQWQSFFEELGRDCRGQRAQVQAQAPGRAWRTIAGDQPFDGIAASDDAEGAVLIELGGGLSYSAGVPQQVRVEEAAAGQTITIVRADGETTTLQLSGARRDGPADEAEDLTRVGGSAGAAGGSVAGPAGSRGAVPDDVGGLVRSASSDDMGGVATPPSGSLGDRDLSGRQGYEVSADLYGAPTLDAAATGAAPISTAQGGAAVGQHHLHPDVIDGGSGQGVLDTGVDPIEGGQLRPATDDDDEMVEGEVGAQAEGDLEERIRRDRARARRPGEQPAEEQ